MTARRSCRVILSLREAIPGGYLDTESREITLTDRWQRLEVTRKLTDPDAQGIIFIAVGANTDEAPCFLLDDAHVVRVP